MDVNSFLLNPDSSEGMKGWGKGRRNLIGFMHVMLLLCSVAIAPILVIAAYKLKTI
jgi:hypothetical protein